MACRLDFPSKAGDFLDGMIRAQIDRLTPWTANDAVFGWSPPAAAANERIEVIFAATSKLKVQPLLQFVQALDAASVAIYSHGLAGRRAHPSGSSCSTSRCEARSGRRGYRGFCVPLCSSAGVAAAASLLLSAYIESSISRSRASCSGSFRSAAPRCVSIRIRRSGLGLLAKRKQTTPSSVMVLEAISRVLPDTTYVTELRIEGDKVQVVGMTQDAPSLIRLMEQSPQFTRATFFAPTTRAANEPGERFHIEAHITAYFGSGT